MCIRCLERGACSHKLARLSPRRPLAARSDLTATSYPNAFGGTYGGNAVACAAALATLRTMDEEGLLENCAARGEQMMAGLNAVSDKYPGVIGEVRGRGLMIGVEFAPDMPGEYAGVAGRVSQAALGRGMLLLTMGTRQCVRFIPPLVVTEAEPQVSTALQIFEESVAQAIA